MSALLTPEVASVLPFADGAGDGGFWATAAPIIPHPMEFFFGLVVFAILYYVVAKRVVPRLEEIYAERTAAIEGGIHKAEEAQAAAEGALLGSYRYTPISGKPDEGSGGVAGVTVVHDVRGKLDEIAGAAETVAKAVALAREWVNIPANLLYPASFADQHVEIFQAVTDGDLPRARRTMRSHLRAVFEDVERIRQRSPELFAADDGSVPVRRSVAVWE